MKRIIKPKFGITVVALFAVGLLLSSPVAAMPSTPSIQTNQLSSNPSLEFASVVPGIDTAVYASIFTFGGVDSSDYPVNIDVDGFANAQSWFVIGLDQQNYANYLNRAPSPVSAPNGMTMQLSYAGSPSASDSETWAEEAADVVNSTLGISMTQYNKDTSGSVHTYVYYDSETDFSSISSGVEGMSSDGFAGSMSASTVNSAPVGWAGFGVRQLDNNQVGMFGMGWVDADGISESGSEYTISSNAIFGGTMTPLSTYGLSRVQFDVPYPIEVVPNGISPYTNNPLPHVTGDFVWNLRSPVDDFYNRGAQSDMSVTYELKTDNSFPNVQSEFSVNQTKLNEDGTLEGEFNLTNTGDQDAHNINVRFPLGEEIQRLTENRTIWTMKPAYDLDASFSSEFNLDLNIAGLGSANEKILDYAGWYEDSGNNLVGWDESNTSVTLVDKQIDTGITGVDTTQVTITISSTNGFPNAVLNAIDNLLVPKLEAASTLSELRNALDADFKTSLKTSFNATLHQFYEETDIFLFNSGDFNVVEDSYWVDSATEVSYKYLNHTVDSLSANGGSTTLKFRIDNIPTESETFQFADYNYSLGEVTLGTSPLTLDVNIPNASVVSSEQNYFDFMQYMFQKEAFDGRPISFPTNIDFDLGLDSFGLDSYHSDAYISRGVVNTYENPNGHRFFGMSNGLNMQIGDNEAVVSATVSLNSSVYHPGEGKEITVDVTNNGDISAENVKVHVYHTTLGQGYRFDRIQKLKSYSVGSVGAQSSNTTTFTVEANSFTGYAPVFAIVEFDSDAGEGPSPIPDFLDEGIDSYEAAGETHHYVFSSLYGSLLVPENPGLNPTVKEARVEVNFNVGTVSDENIFDLTITVTNVGEADTTMDLAFVYKLDELDYIEGETSSSDVVLASTSNDEFGAVGFLNAFAQPGDEITVTLTLEVLAETATIYPILVDYTIAGESSLGTQVNTGISASVSYDSLLSLDAGAAAQQQSQKDATEDSSSSSYSASSSVGASVNPNVDTDTQTVDDDLPGAGFLGPNAYELLGLMLVPLGLFAFFRRRNKFN